MEIIILEARKFGTFIFDITAEDMAKRKQKRIWAYTEVLRTMGPCFIVEPVKPEFRIPSLSVDPSEPEIDKKVAEHKERYEDRYQRALERYHSELAVYTRGLELFNRLQDKSVPTVLEDTEDSRVMSFFCQMMLDGVFTETTEYVRLWETEDN